MNLYQKIRNYYRLRKQGFSHKYAFREFKSPLTDGDVLFIGTAICIALICVILYYANAIDSAKIAIQKQEYMHYIALHKERQKTNLYKSESFKNGALVASIMNGSIIENGRIVTYCRRNAAGDCNAP